MKNFLGLLSMSILIVACNGAAKKKANSFELALEAHTGEQYTVAKANTSQAGYVVLQNNNTGEYVAYNLSKWNDTTSTMASYEASLSEGDVLRNLGKIEVESGGEYTSTTTYYTYGGLRFENKGGVSKDLDTIAAMKESAAQVYLSHKFQSEFSLSSQRAEELASLATRYQRLENSRELTKSEKDTFALKALGVSMTQIETAVKNKAQGQDKDYQQLLEKAAEVNKTTPEEIGRFFDEMIGEELI